jgi:xylan 1,4-beta-xylosidase
MGVCYAGLSQCRYAARPVPMRRARSLWAFVAIIFGPINPFSMEYARAQTASADLRVVTVDVSAVVGHINALTGFNGAPYSAPRPVLPAVPGATPQAPRAPVDPANAAKWLREVGVTTSRTHDSGGGDTMYDVQPNPSVIFPDKDADPNQESSYSFGATDLVISSMIANGIIPYFRVGDGHDGFLPPDFTKYAEIVRHIVLHYNKGWDKGYRLNIKYWEFWNEPDFNLPGRALYFAGTPEQYFDFYAKVAPAIKAADKNALVGGPTTGGNNPRFIRPFLKYVRDHHLPFDFYAYHWYAHGSNDPYDYTVFSDRIRSALNDYGFSKRTPILITEWGYDLAAKTADAQMPTFLSAALSYMQDTPMVMSYYHQAGVGPLYTADGITSVGRAFEAQASFQATPDRLKTIGNDTIGFTTLAGRATTKSTDTAAEIRILITNYEIPELNRGPRDNGKGLPNVLSHKGEMMVGGTPQSGPTIIMYGVPRRSPDYVHNRGYDLTVTNLPAWAREGFTVNRYRIDDAHNDKEAAMTLVDSTTHSGLMLHMSAELPPPAIELIVIRATKSGRPTLGGVWVAPGDPVGFPLFNVRAKPAAH